MVWYTQLWRTDDGVEFDTGWTNRRERLPTKPFRFATLVGVLRCREKVPS